MQVKTLRNLVLQSLTNYARDLYLRKLSSAVILKRLRFILPRYTFKYRLIFLLYIYDRGIQMNIILTFQLKHWAFFQSVSLHKKSQKEQSSI